MARLFIYFFFYLLFVLPSDVIAQKAYITEEPAITNMMRTWISSNRSKESIRGWRIQIITTDDRRQMDRARGKFQSLFPEIPLSWEHESPYYKVQVGAYDDKLLVQRFLQQIKNDFPTAIPVMDDIKKSELISIQ